jgi:biotin carboxyl carrier protein
MKKLRVTVNGVAYEVDVEIISDDADTSVPAAAPPPPPPAPSPAQSRPSAAAGAKSLTSPLPGVVKGVNVKAGDTVAENDPLIVLEAMKMETIISSPFDGKIKEVLASPSQNVMQGDTLVTFE